MNYPKKLPLAQVENRLQLDRGKRFIIVALAKGGFWKWKGIY